MTLFNIVDLITNNPITKLTETHNNNLLNKVKITFNERATIIYSKFL